MSNYAVLARTVQELVARIGGTVTPRGDSDGKIFDFITRVVPGRDGLVVWGLDPNPRRATVKWIRQLKREAEELKAQRVIAVSANGFTPTALVRAREFSIVPRLFRQATTRGPTNLERTDYSLEAHYWSLTSPKPEEIVREQGDTAPRFALKSSPTTPLELVPLLMKLLTGHDRVWRDVSPNGAVVPRELNLHFEGAKYFPELKVPCREWNPDAVNLLFEEQRDQVFLLEGGKRVPVAILHVESDLGCARASIPISSAWYYSEPDPTGDSCRQAFPTIAILAERDGDGRALAVLAEDLLMLDIAAVRHAHGDELGTRSVLLL